MPATGGLTPLAGSQRSFGYGKQSAWGTSVTPTGWWLWEDGSGFDEESRVQIERSGDGSPWNDLSYKAGQWIAGTIVEKCRPRTMGCAIGAWAGSGSDTYTAPTKSTTLAANIVVGATSFQSTADLGNVGTLPLNFSPGLPGLNYEVQTADLTSRSGTGPWVYTLAAGATFKRAHTSGDALTSKSTHVFKRLYNAVYDPFTIETGIGVNGTAPYDVLRYIDAICTELHIIHELGRPLRMQHTWYALSEQRQTVLTAVVLEAEGQIGNAGAPFMFHQAQGNWVLDGGSTNNAVTVTKMELVAKNTTSIEDYMLEGLNPVYATPDNADVQVSMDVLFQSFDQYYETYFGNTKSPAATAKDSYLVGQGSFSTSWVADAVNAFSVNLASAVYTAAKKPKPSLSNKPVHQQLMLTALRTPSVADPVSFTLTNSQNNQY